MRAHPAGTAGLPVTRLGVGLAAIGRPAYITPQRGDDLGVDRAPQTLEAAAHDLLDAAYAAGVRYLDAARSYGRAEAFLASWLARRAPADVTVASKWGYTYVGEWQLDAAVHEVKDHGVDAFERQLAETRALLGDALAVYQIHSATLDTGVLEDRAVHAALARLRDRGVVVGFTTSGPNQAEVIRRALSLEVDGAPLFGVVQSTWNLLEPSAGSALAEASDAGLVVVVKESLANGRLAVDVPAALTEVARDLEASPDALAIAAVAAQPWASVILSGAVTEAQLRSNLAGLALTCGPDELAALAGLAEPPQRYWQARSARPWR